MKKQEILDNLKKLNIDKNKYIVINDASLVVQDIIEETNIIELACSKEINLNNDNFIISKEYFDLDNIIIIDDYRFMNLEKCYEIKKMLNKKQDKKIIEKLDLYLCKKDNRRYEKELIKKGYKIIAGVDEVGRGPLIGPVVACCSVLKDGFNLKGLTDSKKLSEKKREEFYDYLIENTIYGLGIVGPEIIDEVNIYAATKIAMQKAIEEVNKKIKIDYVLTDAMPLDLDVKVLPIIKGDIKSLTISAASVIAKVVRDRMMIELDKKYPLYGYKLHKGYPTKKHIEAINKYGLIEGYRKTYGPVKELLETK